MTDDAPADRLTTPLRAGNEPVVQTTGPPVLSFPRRTLRLDERFAVMGILNRTPDSFYDRGATAGFDAALARGRRLIGEGADILDIGGIKGGPGDPVPVDEEIDRVAPLVATLRQEHPQVLLSVDTFRAPVAAAVLEEGADIINDVTGLHDPDVLSVVAEHGAGYVAMHHGGAPRTRPFRPTYHPDVTTAVVEHCRALTARALDAGIDHRRILVDPGHDFQKTTYHSLELCRRLPELAALGYPVLVALSNKDFVGETLDAPLDRRVTGSLAAAVFCLLRGANVVRVHEVARSRDAVRMLESLLGRRGPAVVSRGLA